MDLKTIGDFISNYGMTAVLMAYFLYKDYKFNENILNVLESIKVVLGKLETHHAKENTQ